MLFLRKHFRIDSLLLGLHRALDDFFLEINEKNSQVSMACIVKHFNE